MLNSAIISEMKTPPSIHKNITNRIEEVGSFFPENTKDFGPIYQLRNKSVYQGKLKVHRYLSRIKCFMVRGSCFCTMELSYSLSLRMDNLKIRLEFLKLMEIISLALFHQLKTNNKKELYIKEELNIKVKLLMKNLMDMVNNLLKCTHLLGHTKMVRKLMDFFNGILITLNLCSLMKVDLRIICFKDREH